MVSLNAKPDWLWIQFVDHNAITAWASHSGLVVDGDKPNLIFDSGRNLMGDGTRTKSLGNLGQSVAMLRKV